MTSPTAPIPHRYTLKQYRAAYRRYLRDLYPKAEPSAIEATISDQQSRLWWFRGLESAARRGDKIRATILDAARREDPRSVENLRKLSMTAGKPDAFLPASYLVRRAPSQKSL